MITKPYSASLHSAINPKLDLKPNYANQCLPVYLCIYIELKEAVLNCDQQIIDVAELDAIWDIKSWLSPHINTPHGHTNPHNFLFQHGESGKAEMRYRNWSLDSWLPLPPQHGVVLLKVST